MYYKMLFILMVLIIGLCFILSSGEAVADNEKQYTIAVLNLEPNGVSQVEALGLSDKLRSYFSQLIQDGKTVKEKYQLIERSQMDKIFEQFEIQNTGCVSDSCAVQFGKMLQCDRIVIGSITLIGETYSVTSRIIDVESGKTIESADRQHKGSIDDVLTSIIPQVGYELLTGQRMLSPITTGKAAENPFVSKVTITGSPEKALVVIDGINIGATPLPVQEIPIGKHTIKINKPGYKRFSEKINAKSNTPLTISYTLDPLSRSIAFSKSFFIPGNGQRYYGYKGKGTFITVVQFITLGGAAASFVLYDGTSKDYDKAKKTYENAIFQNDIDKAFQDLEDQHNSESDAAKLEKITIGAAAAVYLCNLLDAVLIKPKREDDQQKNTFFIEPRFGKEQSGIYTSMRF